MSAVLSIKVHQFSLGVAVRAFLQAVVRHPGEFNGCSIHSSSSTTRTFYFKEQLYFPLLRFSLNGLWENEQTVVLATVFIKRPYCYLFLLSVFILWFSYYVSDIFCKF